LQLHARLSEQDAIGKQNMQLLQAELETARAALRRERDARMKYVTASRRTDIDVRCVFLSVCALVNVCSVKYIHK
jgi:hypothetical protein